MENTRRQFLKYIVQSTTGLLTLHFATNLLAASTPDHFPAFMQFSTILTEDNHLNPEFGQLCWRYVQMHSQASHIAAMLKFLNQENLEIRQTLLEQESDLKSISHQTLSVWYKGDITAIPHTKEEAKLAYIHALKWKALGAPARGLCRENWSKACTT